MDSDDEFTEGTQYRFTAFLDSVKVLYGVLKALNFEESAIFCATENGLKITVEQSKCVQANAYISADNFNEYRVKKGSDVEFKISLTVLTECLNIFGAGEESSLKIYYKCEGAPLLLVLEHLDDVMTDCEIKTQEPEELMCFQEEDTPEYVAGLMMKSSHFLSILNDLEKVEVLQLRLSPDDAHINIHTVGGQDKSQVQIPVSSEMVHNFSCTEDVNLSCKFSHIKIIMRAMGLSERIALKIDSRRLLRVQQMIKREDKNEICIEYFVAPLINEDSD